MMNDANDFYRFEEKYLIDALNNSIGFTYGYLRFTPSGLDDPEGVKCE
jgi:hypothetical protein